MTLFVTFAPPILKTQSNHIQQYNNDYTYKQL